MGVGTVMMKCGPNGCRVAVLPWVQCSNRSFASLRMTAHIVLDSRVGVLGGQEVFDVVEHVVGFAEGVNPGAAHVGELAVAHGDDDGVVAYRFRFGDGEDAVFMPD